jgi:hypothetical protein
VDAPGTVTITTDTYPSETAVQTAEATYSTELANNIFSSAGGLGFGLDLTTTTSSGTGTVIPVADPGVFQPTITSNSDMGVIYAGDEISISGTTRTVVDRDLVGNTITLDAGVTYTNGEPLNLANITAGYTGLPPEAEVPTEVNI